MARARAVNAFPGDGKAAGHCTLWEQNIAGTGLIDQIALELFQTPNLIKENNGIILVIDGLAGRTERRH